ncbi:MAG: amino acid racemase [Phycisphaerales bacterium]|nr:MAG: amino acid racemase [Phycisphaerales bacterium]
MVQHIGIVACGAEGASLCYRTICQEAGKLLGEHRHPEVTMHTHSASEYLEAVYVDDWTKVAELMLSSVRTVAQAGAAFAICPDNTIHRALDMIRARSPIPWIHIAEEVVQEAQRRGNRSLGITGTKYLMTSSVYRKRLGRVGIAHHIPDETDREKINRIILKELVKGEFSEVARVYFNEVIAKLKDRGCDAVVLGCTEIPLLVRADDCPLPTLDSTRLLARAALRESIEET